MDGSHEVVTRPIAVGKADYGVCPSTPVAVGRKKCQIVVAVELTEKPSALTCCNCE